MNQHLLSVYPTSAAPNGQYIIPHKMASQSALIDSFISVQDVKESSRRLYRRTIRQYFNWLSRKDLVLPDVSRVDILNYKEDLLKDGLSPLTVGSYTTVVRKFYEWAEAEKYYPNVARGVKSPKRSKRFKKSSLSIEQCQSLINQLKGGASLRDFATVNLLLRGGLRTIELIRADVEDIVFKGDRRVLLLHGKGRDEKDSFVILTEKTYKPIRKYLDSRGRVKAKEPLFVSESNNNRDKRLTTRTISKIAKEALKGIGLDAREFTAHSLRHTTAVNILRAGGAIEDAQSVLRHSSPVTTQIYIESIKEEMRLKKAPEDLIDSIL